jgi:ATP-dependent Lhr-like helicase
VVFRSDLDWLLEAARTAAPAAEPTVGATAEIIEVLRARGASFAADLAAATRRLPDDIERGLWEGVTRGLIMCDGFGAIRARVSSPRSRPPARRLSRLGRAAPGSMGVAAAGRWALVPTPHVELDRDDLAEAVAEQLLRRWGVVFRDLAVRDSLRLPWREVQWALRRLEDRGLVRGGRFVTGFSGEQYALPEAAEQLTHIRKVPRNGERVVVNATDPLNLVGVVVPGDAVPAVRTNRIVFVDGVPETSTDGAQAVAASPDERVLEYSSS